MATINSWNNSVTAANVNFSGGTFTVASGTNAINISNDNAITTIQIGTGGPSAKTVTLGSNLGSSTTTVQSASGTLNLNSTTGTVNLSSNDNNTTVNIATSGASGIKTLTIGATNTSSTTAIRGGSNASAISITSTNGGVTINSGTGALAISNDASATSLSIGTGGAVKTVTVGSTNSTSTTSIACGTGGASIGNSANNHTTTVGSTNGTCTTVVQAGSGGITLTGAVTSANAISITSGDMTLSSGNLKLPSTTSAVGQIQINATRFITYYNGNTVVGSGSSNFTTTGTANVFVGDAIAASLGASANSNVAVGSAAMHDATTAAGNTAVGFNALYACTTGNQFNVAVGYNSLSAITTGAYNTICGASSATAYTTTDSSNILLGYGIGGTAGTSNNLIIGNATGTGNGNINKAFICGIRGITTGNADAIAVLVDSANQLGTVSSSIRYKEDVQNLIGSDAIYELRPVTFKYKQDKREGWGLIAEEVKEILPALVAHNQKGEVESVKYHDLPVLLLAEIQKLRKELDELKRSM